MAAGTRKPARRNSSKLDADVIIVGAGVAGLAAANACEDRGLRVLILEARERIGGRIFTHRIPGLAHPIELGAEFIHGEPKETLKIARAQGLTYYDCLDLHHINTHPSSGRLVEKKNYFDRIDKIMQKLSQHGKHDRSFDDFVRARHLSGETRDLAIAFAEGFNAGPKELMSERGLARANDDVGDESQTNGRRFAGGYDDVAGHLGKRLRHPGESIRLGTVVSRIAWSKDGVSLEAQTHGHAFTFRARYAIVTLPIGVLQAPPGEIGAVEFSPELPEFVNALGGVGMGHATRLILQFRSPVWLSRERKKVGFLHGSHRSAFQTWWTMMPANASIITAWAGGPASERLTGKSTAELTTIALENLAGLLGRSASSFAAELTSAHHHDWTLDPFSRGAYSYIRVHGSEKADRLAHGFKGTLFFAGEGTHTGSARGTVEGAIETGLRAAGQIPYD